MSIRVPEKKHPQISVSRNTYIALQNLKFELRARSINDTISELLARYHNEREAVLP